MPARSAAVYRAATSMPSGVDHGTSASPPAAASDRRRSTSASSPRAARRRSRDRHGTPRWSRRSASSAWHRRRVAAEYACRPGRLAARRAARRGGRRRRRWRRRRRRRSCRCRRTPRRSRRRRSLTGPRGVSRPAMPKKLAAAVLAWAVAADEPNLARNTAGRLPDAAAASTLARRRLEAGRPAIRRCPSRGPSAGGPAPSTARELADADDRCAAMVDVGVRAARVAAMRSSTMPASTAARKPPAASTSWKTSQARSASCSVSRSTYHDPPAGSITLATFDSIASTDWVLRARRAAELARHAGRRRRRGAAR